MVESDCTAKENSRSLHYAPPDFLWNLVALASFIRLSLRKAAYVVVCECREVGNLGTLCRKNISRKAWEQQVPPLRSPQISCGTWWRWHTSCAFLYGKAHTWSLRVRRGRKSGYASVGMTIQLRAEHWWLVERTADPSATLEMTKEG
jgi:hypothetical protein